MALALLLSVIGVLIALLAAGAVLIAPYAEERMDMTLMKLPAVNRPATLYAREPSGRADREGELTPAPNATLAPPERRIYVSYEDMPADLIHAFVAIEDKRFYKHHGVDILRTARAASHYLTGNASFGGSTITQQLVKNLTGHDETTADRKLREIFLAMDLERHADKRTILECYLNIINLSEGCRGVGAAAQRYFSKATADLTLPECATIAAITQNPAKYNPMRHPAAARGRRDLILSEMCAQGYITAAARDAAQAAELGLVPGQIGEGSETAGGTVSSWYADMVAADVMRDLCERLGYTRATASELLYSGGLSIETAMDRDLQAIVEAYYADLTHFPVGEAGRPQSSFLLMDPYTGDILAVAGAVGEKTANRLQSYATDTRRPAGSCIKPLSLYAPACEEGLILWSTPMEDAPVSEKNGVPWPRNADGLYRGRMTVGESLAESVNTVAVRLLSRVGEDRALAYLRDRFGLTSLRAPDGEGVHDGTVSSLALGQQSVGVTSRELTAAYTAFFGGVYRAPVSYHRVLDRAGRVLLENPRDSGRAVLSAETAALMTRLLEGVTDHGTAAKYLTLTDTLGISCAGKTGTTQNNCDRRFVGYTPRLLGGVWMGYDYPTELRGIPGNPCVGIWDDLVKRCERAYRGAPPCPTFETPELVEADFCPLSGERPNPYCGHFDVASDADVPSGEGAQPEESAPPVEHGWFRPGTEPQNECSLHEEPPVHIIPDDPTDPDRIPLLPGDLSPDQLPPESPTRPWYSRWFAHFSRG